MSEPDSLDEARKAKELGDLLDSGGDSESPELKDLLGVARNIRSHAGGSLGAAARDRLSAELFPVRRRSPLAIAAGAAAAIAALLLVATSLLFPMARQAAPAPLVKKEASVMASSARESLALLLPGTSTTRAEETLRGAFDEYRAELATEGTP